MTHRTASTSIDAPLEDAWAALLDVESWPRWTPSMTSVRRLDAGPLRVGSAARIEQPGLRPLTWTVTELAALSTFTWTAKTPGIALTGKHAITADGPRTHLALAADGDGPLARVADVLAGRQIQRYLELEAAGLKAAAEHAA